MLYNKRGLACAVMHRDVSNAAAKYCTCDVSDSVGKHFVNGTRFHASDAS